MGDRDLIKPLLERQGFVHFGRVLMKPGNPVSSFVCFNLVALPALRKMSGWAQPMLRRVSVRICHDLRLDHERPEYHRCTISWCRCPVSGLTVEGVSPDAFSWWALSTGNQISSRLLSARSANALLELPQASSTLPAGSVVSALLIDDLQIMPEDKQGLMPPTPGFV
eukprot:gene23127-30328_t